MKAPIIKLTAKEFLDNLPWRSWDEDFQNPEEELVLEVLTVHFERENMRVRINHGTFGKQSFDMKFDTIINKVKEMLNEPS